MVWKGPQVHSKERRAVSFTGGKVCTAQSRIRPLLAVLQGSEPMVLTSLIGHSWERRSWSSFCSSFLVPRDCWTRRKSESSFRPASVKYLAKWSTLCLLTGKSSSSLLSKLAFLKEEVTELASFSAIHALKSLTANEATMPSLTNHFLLKSNFRMYVYNYARFQNINIS